MVENPPKFPTIFRTEWAEKMWWPRNLQLRSRAAACLHCCPLDPPLHMQHPHSCRQLPAKTEKSQGTETGSFYNMQVFLPRYPCTSQEKNSLRGSHQLLWDWPHVCAGCRWHSPSATPDLGSESNCLLISRRQWKLLSISSERYSPSLRTQACPSARHRELFPLPRVKSFLTLPNGSC